MKHDLPSRVQRLASLLAVLAGFALVLAAGAMDRAWHEDHVLRRFCVERAGELARIVALRVGIALAGVAIAVFGRAPAARLVARSSPRDLAASAARVGLAALLGLVACELGLRWRAPLPPFQPAAANMREDGRRESYLPATEATPYGWRLAPATTTVARVGSAGREVHYDVNAFGHRAASVTSVPDFTRPAVLVIGESVAMGTGLPYEETLVARLADRLGVQAVALGVHGYAHDQAYLRLLEELPRFARPVAVVTLVLPEQLERDVLEDRPRLALRDGALVLVDAAPELVRSSPLRLLARRVFPNPGTASVAVARAVFEATARAARARGAAALFVFTKLGAPCLATDGEPRIARALLHELPHVQVALDATALIPGDAHPDADGARRMADAIEHALRASATDYW